MKTVIIVDDEPDARQLLRQYLAEVPGFHLIGEADDGEAAVRLINERRPDLVFLDVRMPGLNGFEVLTRLREVPRIIFSTAYDQYALRAFEVHALDYLLKPYGRKRFGAAIGRLATANPTLPLADSLLAEDQTHPHRIILQRGNRRPVRDARDIEYVSAFGDYGKVHFRDETLLSGAGISALAERLADLRFLRVHRSSLVNMDRARELVRRGRYWYVVLESGTEVRVSEGYLGSVRELFL